MKYAAIYFYILIFFFLLSGITCLHAQNSLKMDSLESVLSSIKDSKNKAEVLNQLSFYYKDIQAEKGLMYAEKAIEITRRTQYEDGLAQGYRNLGLNYFYLGNYGKALENYQLALDISEQQSSDRAVLIILTDIGILYSNQGDYNKALEYYLRSLEINEKKIKSNYGTALSANNIGILYYRLKDYKKSEAYFKKSIETHRRTGKPNSESDALLNLGNVYREELSYDKAESIYQQAEDLFEKEKDFTGLTEVSLNSGHNYKEIGNFRQAESQYLKALKYTEETGNRFLKADTYLSLGKLYLLQINQNPSALHQLLNETVLNLNTALAIYFELKSWDFYQQAVQLLSEAYRLKEDYKNALYYSDEHSRYKDSVFNEKRTKELTRLEMNYEFAKKEDSLKLQTAISETELKTQKQQFWILGTGFIIVSLLGSLLYYQNRLTNKKNKQLDEANRTKTRFFNVLNHDLRSPVSELIRFLYLKKDNPEMLDNETIERLDNHTIKSAENLLVSMEDLLLWSKGQMENFSPQPEKVSINKLFQETEREFSGKENISFIFEHPDHIKLFTDKNYLKTIMRNLTSNAIKALEYTPDAQIIWKAYKENGKTMLSITDNGAGGSDEQFRALYDDKHVVGIKTGLGLHLVRDMAKAIQCKVEVDSELGKGITIKLLFEKDK